MARALDDLEHGARDRGLDSGGVALDGRYSVLTAAHDQGGTIYASSVREDVRPGQHTRCRPIAWSIDGRQLFASGGYDVVGRTLGA